LPPSRRGVESPERTLTPDLIVGGIPREAVTIAPHEAVLVAEVTSPGNAVVDRTAKKTMYAEAKIGWYLLVEPDFNGCKSLTLQLFRLQGNGYVLHAAAKHGEPLTSTDPFPLEIDTAALLDF
jgi:Uma2 family endonuclease